MEDRHECKHTQCTHVTSSLCQTVSEMDWERGIWSAAFNNEIIKVQNIIDKAKNAENAVNALDQSGYTALHYAARNGHLDVCQLLLKYGAHINAQTKSGKATPLHKAAAAGSIATVIFLINAGANVEMQDVDGQTVLQKAIGSKNSELVNLLRSTYPQLSNIKDSKGLLPVIS